MQRRRLVPLVALASAAGLALTACSSPNSSAAGNDQKSSNDQMSTYQRNQPVPKGNYSEMRQTLIKVEEAEIAGTATTTFFFANNGQLLKSCPSIGYPIPATTQLTNPDQVDYNGGSGGGGNVTLPQNDPTGVYSGNTSGTYVVCVQSNGQQRVDYWEGYVETEGGQATTGADGKITDSGQSTVTQGSHK
jgi:hypothetical protein